MTNAEGTLTDTDVVSVSRVLAHPVSSVWGALMAPHGAEALLGEGGELGGKGSSWHAADGTFGVTRSFHPQEQIRFSWHAGTDAPATLVDVHLRPAGDGNTELEILGLFEEMHAKVRSLAESALTEPLPQGPLQQRIEQLAARRAA